MSRRFIKIVVYAIVIGMLVTTLSMGFISFM